jgi:hypothetical protein
MTKKTTDKKESFTRLWGVRFSPDEAKLIEDEARAKSLKTGSYIRMAAMETAKLHRRERLGQ